MAVVLGKSLEQRLDQLLLPRYSIDVDLVGERGARERDGTAASARSV